MIAEKRDEGNLQAPSCKHRQVKMHSWRACCTPAPSWRFSTFAATHPSLETAGGDMGDSRARVLQQQLPPALIFAKSEPKLNWTELPDAMKQPPRLTHAPCVQHTVGSSGQGNLNSAETMPQGIERSLRGGVKSPHRGKHGLKASSLVSLLFYICKTEEQKGSPCLLLQIMGR